MLTLTQRKVIVDYLKANFGTNVSIPKPGGSPATVTVANVGVYYANQMNTEEFPSIMLEYREISNSNLSLQGLYRTLDQPIDNGSFVGTPDLYDETAEFDTFNKDLDDENYKVETITENLRILADRLKLGNLLSDTFGLASADGNSWKWKPAYIMGMASNNGSANINTTIAGEGYVKVDNSISGSQATYALVLPNKLTGDFDIQVDMNNVPSNIPNNCWCGLLVALDKDFGSGQDWMYVTRIGGGTQDIYSEGDWNGVSDFATFANAATSLKLRIVRSGTVIKTYYDIGGGWVEHLSLVNGDIDDLEICLFTTANTSTTLACSFDDFKVNSGSLSGTPYRTVGEVVTPSITNTSLDALTINYSGVSATETLTVKILRASDDGELWSGSAITTGTSATYTSDDFGSITVNIKVKIEFTGDGTASPEVSLLSVFDGTSLYALARDYVTSIVKVMATVGGTVQEIPSTEYTLVQNWPSADQIRFDGPTYPDDTTTFSVKYVANVFVKKWGGEYIEKLLIDIFSTDYLSGSDQLPGTVIADYLANEIKKWLELTFDNEEIVVRDVSRIRNLDALVEGDRNRRRNFEVMLAHVEEVEEVLSNIASYNIADFTVVT